MFIWPYAPTGAERHDHDCKDSVTTCIGIVSSGSLKSTFLAHALSSVVGKP